MNNYYVYCLYTPWDGIEAYIGKGKERRIKKHFQHGEFHPNYRLAEVFKRAKGEGLIVSHKILFDNLDNDTALNIERDLIRTMGRLDLGTGPLCNATDGGDGPYGYIHTPERKEKIRKALTGKPKSATHIQNISIAAKARDPTTRKHSEATKQKIGKAHKGRTMSPEARAKMSLAKKGKPLSPERREFVANLLRRPKSEAHKQKLREHLKKVRFDRRLRQCVGKG